MPATDHRTRVAADRRDRMRARLLDAALALAAEGGPAAVTIDSVITAAGVSRGTFYKYFDAPGPLLQSLGVELADALIRAIDPLVQPLDDPAERVATGLRAALRLVAAHPLLGAFIARAGWPAQPAGDAFFSLVGADVSRGMRTGRFVRMRLDVALNLLAGTVIGAMHTLASPRPPRQLADQSVQAVLRGLGLPDEEATRMLARPPGVPRIEAGSVLARILGGAPSRSPAPAR